MSPAVDGGSAWIVSLARVGTWLCAFLFLAAGRYVFEQRLIARFRRRSLGWDSMALRARVSHRTSPGRTGVRIAALVAAVLAGAAIPLGPTVQVGTWRLALHLFESSDAGLLYVLTMGWISTFLLALAQEDRPRGRPAWHSLGAMLFNMLPLTLIVANLALTTSALGLEREGTLTLEPWIALQSSWNGWRWMGVLQPLLMVGWMIYAVPPRTGPQMQTSFVRQIQCLDMALLTSTLFLGGWQGPLVLEHPTLGLLYTAIKVGIVSFIWVWAWASLPQSGLVVRARDTWTVAVPVIVLNLLVTTMVVAR